MKSPEVRFWNKVKKGNSKECWLWTGAKTGTMRYGGFRLNGKQMNAHRASWIIHNGPILNSLHCLHKCDNPPCVNPSHLFLGTNLDNMRDRHLKGRTVISSGDHHNKYKKVCIKGHPLSGDNLRLSPKQKWRICRECNRFANIPYRMEKKMLGLFLQLSGEQK